MIVRRGEVRITAAHRSRVARGGQWGLAMHLTLHPSTFSAMPSGHVKFLGGKGGRQVKPNLLTPDAVHPAGHPPTLI